MMSIVNSVGNHGGSKAILKLLKATVLNSHKCT